jgi:competence protein ComEC
MKSGLPDELDEKLRTVGLVHIVVASGAHLSILVEVARKIFGKMSRFSGLLFSILFVVFFMAMVGWTPSIMRAGIMTILTLLAWYVGRKFAPWRIILLVAAGTLLFNPMFIINLGWLLSFASYGGIMILGPKFVKFFFGTKKPGFVASIIITTISATVMTLAIILYFYGTVSLISVLANLLILPTLPYAMGLVFLVGVVAGVPGIEIVVGFVATKLLDFHIAVVNFFGNMKSFLIEIEPYQIWAFLIYVLIFGVLISNSVRARIKNACGIMKI